MIYLDALEKAFASIEKLGQTEDTFLVSGVPVTVKPLRDEENIQIWKYASVALESGEDSATQQEWMHRMKTATLAYAIVQIGDTDLRATEVDTGEVLSNGTPIKRKKFEVVRGILAKWPSPLLLRVFARFGDFVSKMEVEAENAVHMEPVDFGIEIERLRNRIGELEKRREQVTNAKIDPMGKRVKAAIAMNQHQGKHNANLTQQAQQAQQARVPQTPIAPPPPQHVSEEPFFDSETTPEDIPYQDVAPLHYSPEQVRQNLAQRSAHQTPVANPDSPFFDPCDQETVDALNQRQYETYLQRQAMLQEEQLQQATLSEQQRAVQARAEAMRARREGEQVSGVARRRSEAAPVAVSSGRKPPHLQAAQAQEGKGDQFRARQVAVVQGAGPGGEDLPVYQFPPQVISGRGQGAGKSDATQPVVNPVSAQSNQASNPHFKPPGRR